MRDNSTISKTITSLRFFCVVLVVYLHAIGSPLDGKGAILYQNGCYDTIRILLSEGVCRVAVPVLFFFSGYLFFPRLEDWSTAIWVEKLRKRWKSLFLPYIIWNSLTIGYSFLMLFPKFLFKGGAAPNLVTWYHQIGGLRAFWDSGSGGFPNNSPLWYIRDLLVFIMLAPVIHFFLKKTGVLGLIVLFFSYLFNLWGRVPGLSEEGLFFFASGAYFSIRKIDFTRLCKSHLVIAAFVSIPLLMIMVFTYGNNDVVWRYAHRLFTVSGSCCTIGMATILLQKKTIRNYRLLSGSSVFIYTAHYPVVLSLMQVAFGYLLSGNQMVLLGGYLLAPLCTVTLLIACFYFLNKWMPKTISVLTGGRNE